MHRKLLFLLLLLPALGVLLRPAPAAAQEAGMRYRIVLTDGAQLTGTLVSANTEEIVLEDERGLRTTIPRGRIRSFEPLASRFAHRDPNSTRLLLFPTARSLKAGTGRFGTYTILPTVAVGATDWLDFSIGGTLPFESVMLINLNGKVTPYQTERMSFAVGASALVPLGADAGGVGGTFYGVATFGTPESAFTIGGLGAYVTNFEDTRVGSGGALVLGYEHQVSNKVKLMTENYIGISEGVEGALLAAGVRFFGDRLSADIAPFVLIGDGDAWVSPIPYFTFSYAFGH